MSASWSLEGLKEVITRHWGFRDFRPLQDRCSGLTEGSRHL